MFSLLRRKFSSILSFPILAVAALFLTVACSSQSSNLSAPIAVSTYPWIGYSGQFIGVEKGLFKQQGLNIQDVSFPNGTEEAAAFLAKKIDIGWFTSGDAVQIASQDPSVKIIYTADYSNGGDGIIGRGITSAADLRGKTVAREDLLFVKQFLRAYLQKAGLTEKDVTVKNMTADVAADAFASQQVDVAVTYEPHLLKAAEEGGGKVIFSTKGTNLIADVIIVRDEFLQSHKAEVQKYLKAVDEGVQLLLANDPEALKIASARLETSESDVKQQKELVKVFDAKDNKEVAFNPKNPQNLMGNLTMTAQAAYEFRIADQKMDASTLINDSLVKAL